MKRSLALGALLGALILATAHSEEKQTPNIPIIWGDEAMNSMDHYAHASCTAGRAAFITGQYPIRADQTALVTQGRKSNRKPYFHFTESTMHGFRYGDWKFLFKCRDMGVNRARNDLTTPLITNVKLDPFERFHDARGFDEWQENRSCTRTAAGDVIGPFIKCLRDYPPRQTSFDIDIATDQMMDALTETRNR